MDDGPVKSGTPPLPVAHGTVQLPPRYENGAVGVETIELELLAVTGEIGVDAEEVVLKIGTLPVPVGNAWPERFPLP